MADRARLAIPILLILGGAIFLPGINWGLPSPVVDPYLFGQHKVWSGKQILRLAGPTEDPDRGADVASHPGADRSGVVIVIVNATDADRARIIRRYRLMSYQPDEWNTLKALSEMKPHAGNFDPKLYQYGGLWVYPVGAMLKLAAMLHLIDLRADVVWYLDHPESFGRFYVVARLWSVIWAFIGVMTVYALVGRILGGWVFPTMAGACFIFMPVVVNMAHEAKPHLAGAVLMLLAVLAGSHYVENGRRRAWIMAGLLCGAAMGMVLTTLPIFLILPVMVMLRKSAWREKIVVCGGTVVVASAVYLITNPYVPINFFHHRTVLESNLGNSQAMYHARLTSEGIANAAYLIVAGTSPLLAIAGVIGTVALGIRAVRVRRSQELEEIRRRATGLLLAVPAVCVMGQWIFVATGKPAEFGRFMLVPDIFLVIEAIVALGTKWHGLPARVERRHFLQTFLKRPGVIRSGRSVILRYSEGSGGDRESARSFGVPQDDDWLAKWFGTTCQALAKLLVITTAIPGLIYVRAFVRDSRTPTSRLAEAERLRQFTADGKDSIAIYADPAPYCLPPVNLFDAPIVLMPKDEAALPSVNMAKIFVRTVDVPEGIPWYWSLWTATPISWADKPLQVRAISSYNSRSPG